MNKENITKKLSLDIPGADNGVNVEAPSLDKLKTELCTMPELQAALVKFIDLYNEQGKDLERIINRKADADP